jgi:anti-sigma factor RsiW
MIALDERCDTIASLSTRYLDGALEASVHTSYETHLVFCEQCVAFLADIREIKSCARGLPPDPIDAAERSRIIAAALP